MVDIYQYSHGLMVRGFSESFEVGVVYDIARKYRSLKKEMVGRGIVKYVTDTIYSLSNLKYTKDISKIFFCILISRKEELISELEKNGISYNLIDETYPIPTYDTGMVLDGKEPWDYQKYYIDYVLSKGTHKLIPIQTGKGKGTIMLASVSQMNCRIFIEAKKSYLGKLKREIVSSTTLPEKEVLLIDSGKKLYRTVDDALAGKKLPTVLLCGIHTLYGYVQDYCSGVWEYDFDSPYNPVNLFKILGVGVRVIDEAHQLFDMIYKIDLVTNVPKAIYMSATYLGSNVRGDLKTIVQQQLIPLDVRPVTMKPDAYTTLIKAPYRTQLLARATKKAENAPYGYTHINYEKEIIHDKLIRDRYFNFLKGLFDEYYINNIPKSGKPEKKRCLFLFSTTNICQCFLVYLSSLYPKLDIRKYTNDDSEVNLVEATVIISTWQSAGTAQDMPGLITLINTVPIKAKETSLQIPGRLRDPKKIGLTMTPYYIMTYNLNSSWQTDTIYTVENNIKDYMEKIMDRAIVNF